MDDEDWLGRAIDRWERLGPSVRDAIKLGLATGFTLVLFAICVLVLM